jgi:hypothetical protein
VDVKANRGAKKKSQKNLHLAEKKELTFPLQNRTNNLRPTRLSASNKETKIFY